MQIHYSLNSSHFSLKSLPIFLSVETIFTSSVGKMDHSVEKKYLLFVYAHL